MVPLLERIPYDVFLDITFLSASNALCHPPTELLALRLTCKALYDYLDVRNSAQLYARLFRCHFDLSPLLLRSPVITVNDSTLAQEYVIRQRLLSRSRKSSWSADTLEADMGVALRMLLESGGANERQLVSANFPQELLMLARVHLQPREYRHTCDSSLGLNYVFVWLLSLTLSKAAITRMSSEERDELCGLLRSYIVNPPITPHGSNASIPFFDLASPIGQESASSGRTTSVPGHHQPDHHRPLLPLEPSGSTLYDRQHRVPLDWLDPAFAAVNIILAVKESYPLLIPPHLPENRAIAMLRGTGGPTMDDFRVFQKYQTPLFADVRQEEEEEGHEKTRIGRESGQSSSNASATSNARRRWESTRSREGGALGPEEWCADGRSRNDSCPRAPATNAKQLGRSKPHDRFDFSHVYGLTAPSVAYEAGTFSGLWQGSYLTQAPVPDEAGVGDSAGFLNRRPMQAVLSEYHCYSPNVPLATTHDASELVSLPTDPWEWDHLAQRHRYELFDRAGTTSVEQHVPAVEEGSGDSISHFSDNPTVQAAMGLEQWQSGEGMAVGESRLTGVSPRNGSTKATDMEARRGPAPCGLGSMTAEALDMDAVDGDEDAVDVPKRVLDTILFGETTPDHDAAWNGFRYIGRIHQDGKVFLKREPKNRSETYLGTWIFEGRLRQGKALVGFWRAQGSTDGHGVRGVFGMTKATNSTSQSHTAATTTATTT